MFQTPCGRVDARATLLIRSIYVEGLEVGCSGCWYVGRSRSGDRLCHRTGELLDYHAFEMGCDARTETPPDNTVQSDPLQPLADRLGVTVEELRRYLTNEKNREKPDEEQEDP